jgi:hypothetical protein
LPFLRVQDQRPTHFLGLLVFAGVGWLGWQINYSRNGFPNILHNLRAALEGLFLRQEVPSLGKEPFGGESLDPVYALVNNLRQLSWAMFAVIVFLLFVYLLTRGSRDTRSRVVALAAAIAGCSLFVAVPSLVGGQYLERAALFGLLPISVLGAFAFSAVGAGRLQVVFRALLVGAVVTAASLLPLTRSAGDAFEWASPGELNATEFMIGNSAGRGPSASRVLNNNGINDFYLQLNRLTNARLTLMGSSLTLRANSLLATTPTGRGFMAVRFQAEERYDDFIRHMDNNQNRVFDGGRGVSVYFVRP